MSESNGGFTSIDAILKKGKVKLTLFTPAEKSWMEGRITASGGKYHAECLVRHKKIVITPEEIVRQLYAKRLIDELGYPESRLVFEYPINFGHEVKRADIVIRDKDDATVPYIIIETKKPTAKDGRDQLKSYTLATGASMAVWTNGDSITYHQRKNPNYFEDIPIIPKESQTLAEILQQPFTIDDLIREDKLTKTGKSLKDLVLEMEDEVLANAGVDVFEEVFKLIFAKLYDEKCGASDKTYNLMFRNSGQSDNQLKTKIEKLFKDACDKWPGVFEEDDKIGLTASHLSICVSSLETVKLFNSNLDVVDEAFEYLMSKSSKGEKGQYFTPRYVIDMCVKMLNPKPDETMIDTAAGSSGFPVHTIFHVWRQMQLDAKKPVSHLFTAVDKGLAETQYVQKKVFAIDFDEKAVRVARTLNLIAGDGHTNVLHLNTLDYGHWDSTTSEQSWIDTYNEGYKKLKKLAIDGSHKCHEFDIVMANPPFAGEVKESQILSRYELGMKKGKVQRSVVRDILFIERNIDFLGAGGRMAIVLPQGRFNNSTDQYIREYIAKRCRILAVVGLHGNTFKPHTGTKTSVLFVQKWQNDKNQPHFNPHVEDYPIFFATQTLEGKNSRGDKLYWTKDRKGTTTDPKLALCDKYGHPIVYHDLFATMDYDWDATAKKNIPKQLTPDGIAEAFAEFAKKEKLDFFSLTPFDKAKYSSLLKGLEIKVEFLSRVRLSDSMRLEAEFYTQTMTAFESISGAEAISFSQYGTSDELNEDGIGVPVLRLNEFDTSFIGAPKKYSPLSSEVYDELRLKAGDVLICRTNGNPKLVGKSAYVPQDCQFAFASYLYRVRTNNDRINAETLVSYLNCKFGRAEIELYAMRGNQANFSPAKFRLIRVPVLGRAIQQKIHELFAKADAQRKIAQSRYAEANAILLRELGFEGWEPSSKTVAVRKYSDFISAGRFDAEYFQPDCDAVSHKLAEYPYGCVLASDMLQTGLVKNGTGAQEKYVELADIGASGEIIGCTEAPFEELPSRARQRIHAGDVIVSSIEGSLERCALVDDEYDGALCSTGFHRFRSTDINAETLMLLFKSAPIQRLLKRGCSGTILCGILPGEFKRISIPLIKKSAQVELAKKVQSSFAARKESKRLLELAKRAVEVAIESGEETGMRLLG